LVSFAKVSFVHFLYQKYNIFLQITQADPISHAPTKAESFVSRSIQPQAGKSDQGKLFCGLRWRCSFASKLGNVGGIDAKKIIDF
jgi:hypothetical protein